MGKGLSTESAPKKIVLQAHQQYTVKLRVTMDIEIELECSHCGVSFNESFEGLSHGRFLKCPVCFSASLLIKGECLVERKILHDKAGALVYSQNLESKFKP